MQPFAQTMSRHGLELRRGVPTTLQINVGYVCNQACKHCHLDAGPDRKEIMHPATMAEVVDFARRFRFDVIDVTGGAPEMIPHIASFIEKLAPLSEKILVRTNLTALHEKRDTLLPLYRERGVSIVASFPSVNATQTEAQRGKNVWDRSIEMLLLLNQAGFGMDGGNRELHLVANPSGAFLPASQCQAERKFREDLRKKWGIQFTRLFTFANVPLGRFKRWLHQSGNYERYMEKLAQNFNPTTIKGLMCRSLISLSFDGILHDCDFNQAAGLPLGGQPRHISTLSRLPDDIPVMTGEHCYACTAGSGFT